MTEEEAIAKIKKALLDKGPNPKFHDAMMEKHRKEWPALWRGLDELVKATLTSGRL